MITKLHLSEICRTHGLVLEKSAPWLDGEILLKSIATVESSYGLNNIPKYEKAYDRGGIYYNTTLGMKYGAWAACSYSSWQIMFPTATELGFTGTPIDLCNDAIAIYWVIEYIKKRALDKGATKIQEIYDAFNSGSFRDKFIPTDYIGKCTDAYIRLKNEQKEH